MRREGYTRIRQPDASGSRPGLASLRHPRRLSFQSLPDISVHRVLMAAILFFICGLVLSLGSIAEPTQTGNSWFLPTGSSPSAPVGPVLSLDIDITNDPGEEVATSHWTSPVEGYLELHGKAQTGGQGGYKLLARVDVGPVVGLEKIVLDCGYESSPSQESHRTSDSKPERASESERTTSDSMCATLILAQANYDQSVGAMSKTTVSTAYAWNGRTLVEVWSATTFSEAVWNLSWGAVGNVKANSWRWGVARERALRDFTSSGGIPATAAKGFDLGPGNWVRLASSSTVQFSGGPVPSVVMESLHEYHSYSEKDDAFKLISSRKVTQTFCWSDRWKTFVLGEGTIGREGAIGMEYPGADDGLRIDPGTDVAILESERKCVEGLVFGPPFLLRVKLPNGRRCFVSEDSVLTSAVESMV